MMSHDVISSWLVELLVKPINMAIQPKRSGHLKFSVVLFFVMFQFGDIIVI